MLLSYETSSIAYDDIDLIHGKFLPAQTRTICTDICNPPPRVFINIYGVFADLTGRFAQRYDNHVIPSSKADGCILDPEYIRNNIPKVGVDAMMEEPDFWKDMKAYPWYLLAMKEFYTICNEDYYLLLPMYDSLQLEDRLTWVWRHFGSQSKDRTMLLTCKSAGLLIKSRNDIFIGSDLVNCEAWASMGGSAFWWPEIDIACKDPSKLLVKRIKLLKLAVHELLVLHPKSKESIYAAGVARDKALAEVLKRS
jgi:hypothetical protein